MLPAQQYSQFNRNNIPIGITNTVIFWKRFRDYQFLDRRLKKLQEKPETFPGGVLLEKKAVEAKMGWLKENYPSINNLLYIQENGLIKYTVGKFLGLLN